MIKAVARVAGTLAILGFIAAGGAAHASPDTGTAIRDGNGADFGLSSPGHNGMVTTATSNFALFTAVDVHGGTFELEDQSNAQCLTVNASFGDEIFDESCGGATSTLWQRSGTLYQSVLLIDAGKTGNLQALPTGNTCLVGDGPVLAEGGQPLECSNSWSGPS
jgi:hypothetical protein